MKAPHTPSRLGTALRWAYPQQHQHLGPPQSAGRFSKMAGEERFYSFSEAGYNQLPAGHQQTSPWMCMQSSGIASLPAGYRALSGEPASAGIGSNQLSAMWAAKRAGAELCFQHGRYSSSGWRGHVLLLLLPTRACGQQHPQSCSLCCNGLRYFLKAASYVCYPCSYTHVNMYVYS